MNDEMKELMKQMMDVREWLVKLDTKLEHFQSINEKAEQADRKADSANMKYDALEQRVETIEKDDRRKWGFIYSIVGGVLIAVIGYIFTHFFMK